jgi:hypothetical protein
MDIAQGMGGEEGKDNNNMDNDKFDYGEDAAKQRRKTTQGIGTALRLLRSRGGGGGKGRQQGFAARQ